jgi:hypothetical protein
MLRLRYSLFLLLPFVLAAAALAQPAPERLVTRSGETEVVLHWDAVAEADGYVVERAALPDGVAEAVGETANAYFIDRSVESGQPYLYTVRALDGETAGPPSNAADALPRPLTDDEFLDLVQVLAFDYFWYEANPATGLVRDRSSPFSASSIAAVGFGLTALGIGADHGWITREQAAERTLTTLTTLWNAPQGPEPSGTAGYKGFFYHFLDMETALRDGTNELSTIDTALLMAGVLYAGEYFDGDATAEAEIRALAQQLYERVDWRWSQAGGSGIRLGWFPESGFIDIRWIGYNEAMILYLLGFGSPTFPAVPDWSFWTAGYDFITAAGFQFVGFPPLFGHQYSHAWIDFRGIQDQYMRQRGLDYFENSRRATLAQRAYCIANPNGYPNYGPNEWGLTASDDPITGYAVHGAPPAVNDNGTLTPTAPGGSIAFTPVESTAALRHMYATYPNSLWREYGFRDAYNLDRTWFATDFLGIDQGPFVLMIENLRTEGVWDVFMRNEAVQLGLERAGFEPTATAAEDGATATAPTLTSAPNPFRDRAELRFTLPTSGPVSLAVFDLLGREVATLLDGPQPAGPLTVALDGTRLPSGVYVVRLRTPEAVLTRKLTVVE